MLTLDKKTEERLSEFAKKYNLKTLEETVNFILDNFSQLNEALSFKDVTLDAGYADFLPEDADITTYITRTIKQNSPLISAAMDTITESTMAIAMAQLGGSGVIHRNLSIEEQVKKVKKVKYAWNFVIEKPITIDKNQTLRDTLELNKKYGFLGFPVLHEKKLVGIITEKDIKYYLTNLATPIYEMMTPKENLIFIEENPKFSQQQYFDAAKPILKERKIDKLPVVKIVGDDYLLKGLITAQDIKKREKFKNASLVDGKTLLVGAAIGCKIDGKENDFDRAEELLKHGKVDYIVVDASHGGSKNVVYMTKELKIKYKDQIQLISGNICNDEHAKILIEAGADALKVGVGPGSICTTRTKSGVGIPQITATRRVALVADQYKIPVITDGGFEEEGEVVRAIAAGAYVIMSGYLFRATKETPGEKFERDGKFFKKYRGMGTIESMLKGSADRYHVDDILLANWLLNENLIPPPTEQGVVKELPYRGEVAKYYNEIIGGLRIGMGLTGKRTIEELRKSYNTLWKVTPEGRREGNVHGF